MDAVSEVCFASSKDANVFQMHCRIDLSTPASFLESCRQASSKIIAEWTPNHILSEEE